MSYHVKEMEGEYGNMDCTPQSPKSSKGRASKSTPYFPSDNPNNYIVNAVTGTMYTYKPGSYTAKQLFHVIDSTGWDESRDPHNLYYNSPEEYMKHRGVKLHYEEINKWHSKRKTLNV